MSNMPFDDPAGNEPMTRGKYLNIIFSVFLMGALVGALTMGIGRGFVHYKWGVGDLSGLLIIVMVALNIRQTYQKCQRLWERIERNSSPQ
jgi:hypothetical protein